MTYEWAIGAAIIIALIWAGLRAYISVTEAINENTIAIGQLRNEVAKLSRAVDNLVNKPYKTGGKK